MSAFIAGDYRLDRGVLGVESIASDTANQIREYLSDYGATLTALPEGTWESSVCMWMGSHWETLVDLWTKEEGRSDLVLHARVFDDRRASWSRSTWSTSRSVRFWPIVDMP